jgi:hypothetical protein
MNTFITFKAGVAKCLGNVTIQWSVVTRIWPPESSVIGNRPRIAFVIDAGNIVNVEFETIVDAQRAYNTIVERYSIVFSYADEERVLVALPVKE